MYILNLINHLKSKDVTFDFVRTLMIFSDSLLQNLLEPTFLVDEESANLVRHSFETSLRDALGGELAVQELLVRDATERDILVGSMTETLFRFN